MHTSSHGRFYFPPGPKRLRVRRGRSRTAAESVCGLDVNQSLSQPTKYIPLMVHKIPELTKLQEASCVGARYTWALELARETELRWKNHLFCCKLKACAGQRVTLSERLDWKTPCLMQHTRETITAITERYLGVLRFCRWSQPGHNQKLAQFVSEIGVERSHSMFCTNCHKIDITTGYCSWAEYIYTRKNNTVSVELSMLHRHLIFSFVYWYNRQVLLLLMICIYLQS